MLSFGFDSSEEDESNEYKDYREWFDSFATEEILFLQTINHSTEKRGFVRNQILSIAGFLDSYKLSKNPELHEKLIDRYLQLIPESLRPTVDKNLLKEDRYYRAWFFNRQCFFENVFNEDMYSKGRIYVRWSPILDNQTPEECYAYSEKIFNPKSEEFLKEVEIHWREIRKGCRCSASLIKEREKDRLLSRWAK